MIAKWGSMKNREKVETVVLYIACFFYVLFLMKLLFFSRFSLPELFDSQRVFARSINLVPFSSIWGYLFGGDAEMRRFAFINLAGNIGVFVPLGTYLILFRKDKRVTTNLLIIVITSLLVEVIQGLFGIGTTDIDDLILNTVSGLGGILGYKLLALGLRGEKHVQTAIAILSALGLPRLLYFLFVIKLRL